MKPFAVQARGLSKCYKLGQLEGGFTQVRNILARRQRQGNALTWALRDVSFDVHEGDALAIVGRNGAGKSTLLKVLSRVTEPTRGIADVYGRVGSLLEVGTGFHGDLTGRENVFLNGSIIGLRRADVKRKFDDIVEFAGVSRFIDTPVKRYSSGMTVRLAFAVAAFLEPEVLIVDEVLAVGDAEFQKRCLGRMNEVANEGRTVLFVSHNMQAVRRLCKRAILLENGELVYEGSSEDVVRRYLASVDVSASGLQRWDDPIDRPGNDFAKLVEVRLSSADGHPATTFLSSQPIMLTFELDIEHVDSSFQVAFDLATIDGTVAFRSAHTDVAEAERPALKAGRNVVRCTIPPGLLNAGRFGVNLRISLVNNQAIVSQDGVLHFDVVADHGDSLFLNTPDRPGLIAPILPWSSLEDLAAEPVSSAASRRPTE